MSGMHKNTRGEWIMLGRVGLERSVYANHNLKDSSEDESFRLENVLRIWNHHISCYDDFHRNVDIRSLLLAKKNCHLTCFIRKLHGPKSHRHQASG